MIYSREKSVYYEKRSWVFRFVWSYDLWVEADNWNRIKQQGPDNKVYPIHDDAST